MSQFETRTLPQLLELVYAAGLDEVRWQAFLDALSAPFGDASGVLYAFDPTRGYVDFHYNYGTDPAYHASYLAHYQNINPYGQPSVRLPVGKVCMANHGVDIGEVLKTEFYNGWMKPQGIPADHFGVVLHKEPGKHVTFGLSPQARIFDRHRDRYARELALLVPHMTRALEINRLTAAARQSELVAGVALEAIGAAAFILAGDGRPVRLNAKAEALMRHDGVLKLDPFGRLQAAYASEDASLAGAFAEQRSARVAMASGPLRLTSPSTGKKFVAWIVGATATEAGRKNLAPGGASQHRPLVLLVHPVSQHILIPAEDIRRTFDLSVAEARLVAALLSGQSISGYAAKAGLSRNTARNHLAAVFAKTGCSRQSELVALVIGSLHGTSSRIWAD